MKISDPSKLSDSEKKDIENQLLMKLSSAIIDNEITQDAKMVIALVLNIIMDKGFDHFSEMCLEYGDSSPKKAVVDVGIRIAENVGDKKTVEHFRKERNRL